MPLYEYQCDACGQRFEVIQKFSDGPPEECRKCGKGPVQRLQSSPAFQFKGTGWYVTDYAKGNPAGGASSATKTDGESSSSESSGASSSETKSETTAKTETKSETKSETPKT